MRSLHKVKCVESGGEEVGRWGTRTGTGGVVELWSCGAGEPESWEDGTRTLNGNAKRECGTRSAFKFSVPHFSVRLVYNEIDKETCI